VKRDLSGDGISALLFYQKWGRVKFRVGMKRFFDRSSQNIYREREEVMPELPEVETVCRQLRRRIYGKRILAGEIDDSKLSHINHLQAGEILNVERRGKIIVIDLKGGLSIKIHLRMTGRLLWQKNTEAPRHSRWRLSFPDGYLFLVDPRRFATVNIEETKKEKITNDLMGDFDEKAFLRKEACRETYVKSVLMDQRAIAGIGNIYACEILHQSGISPLRKASSLSMQEWKKIFTAARRILKKGIKKRGTSISDWRDLDGCPGENQHELKVYHREGNDCSNCGSNICRIKQEGRSTFYCPRCQR